MWVAHQDPVQGDTLVENGEHVRVDNCMPLYRTRFSWWWIGEWRNKKWGEEGQSYQVMLTDCRYSQPWQPLHNPYAPFVYAWFWHLPSYFNRHLPLFHDSSGFLSQSSVRPLVITSPLHTLPSSNILCVTCFARRAVQLMAISVNNSFYSIFMGYTPTCPVPSVAWPIVI